MKPPFDLLRGVFWLIAIMVGVVLFMMIGTTAGCFLGVGIGVLPIGHCNTVGAFQLMREWWNEILTAILALLVASRPPPPSPPPSKGDQG